MSLTPSDRHWHRIYRAASPELSVVIEDAFCTLDTEISFCSPLIDGEELIGCNDDRAEALIAAIMRFVCESNPEHPAVEAALESAAKEDAP